MGYSWNMLTPTQADEIADRIAQRLMAVIDTAAPMPEFPPDCGKCAARGFWMDQDGDIAFCSCEVGKARKRRQAVMNRMVAVGYTESRRRRL